MQLTASLYPQLKVLLVKTFWGAVMEGEGWDQKVSALGLGP